MTRNEIPLWAYKKSNVKRYSCGKDRDRVVQELMIVSSYEVAFE